LGFSFFDGEVQVPEGEKKQRFVGVDASYYLGSYTLLGELSYGDIETDSADLISSLIEINWSNRYETLNLYLQAKKKWRDTQDNGGTESFYRNAIGLVFFVTRQFDLSAEAARDDRGSSVAIQWRLRV
jgi:hypothetical protein